MKRIQLSGKDYLEFFRIADFFQLEDRFLVEEKGDETVSYQVRGVTLQEPQSGIYKSDSLVHIELIAEGSDGDWSLPDIGVRATVTDYED